MSDDALLVPLLGTEAGPSPEPLSVNAEPDEPLLELELGPEPESKSESKPKPKFKTKYIYPVNWSWGGVLACKIMCFLPWMLMVIQIIHGYDLYSQYDIVVLTGLLFVWPSPMFAGMIAVCSTMQWTHSIVHDMCHMGALIFYLVGGEFGWLYLVKRHGELFIVPYVTATCLYLLLIYLSVVVWFSECMAERTGSTEEGALAGVAYAATPVTGLSRIYYNDMLSSGSDSDSDSGPSCVVPDSYFRTVANILTIIAVVFNLIIMVHLISWCRPASKGAHVAS